MERNVKQMKKSGENGKHLGKNWKTLEKKLKKLEKLQKFQFPWQKLGLFLRVVPAKMGM